MNKKQIPSIFAQQPTLFSHSLDLRVII